VTERLTDVRQLNVWQKAHKLVLDIYELTKKFPKEEKAELASLIRKASMRVPIQIAEGFMRRSPQEKEHQYKTSQESLEELKYYLILSIDLEYIKDGDDILESVDEVARMLTGLVRSTKG
jgi:four helix bundle protein